MMVTDAVLLKTPFINAGRYHALIPDRYRGYRSAGLVKRLLNADGVSAAVVFFSDSKHISAQINQTFRNSLRKQIFFHLIGDISFCNAAGIQGCVRIC